MQEPSPACSHAPGRKCTQYIITFYSRSAQQKIINGICRLCTLLSRTCAVAPRRACPRCRSYVIVVLAMLPYIFFLPPKTLHSCYHRPALLGASYARSWVCAPLGIPCLHMVSCGRTRNSTVLANTANTAAAGKKRRRRNRSRQAGRQVGRQGLQYYFF